ncbi:MAG: hypothetical protein AAF515_12430 [Pseudomonadota bacterium]
MSDAPLFSAHWHRVRDLRARLAPDVLSRRHRYRGELWYVLHRPSVRGIQRVNYRAFQLLNSLDGDLTIESAWDIALREYGDLAPTQDEVIELLATLHEAELLVIDRKLDAEQLFARAQAFTDADTQSRLLNPLFMRFNLGSPDRVLAAIAPYCGWLFAPVGLFAWVALSIVTLLVTLPQSDRLMGELAAFDPFAPQNALILLLYPLLKLFHELSHGLVVRRYGGSVGEWGVALMVLMPIPYVDASAASLFNEKRRRMLVGAAGIMAELGIAALAAILWSLTDAGMLHDAALLLVLIGSLSTLLINGNPLLKFDGYYVLADLLEIPNLTKRSIRYTREKLAHGLLGIRPSKPLETADSTEGWWLFGYCTLATVYRFALMLGIAYWLSGEFFFIGVLLGLWVLFNLFVRPAVRFVRFLSRQRGSGRVRASGAAALIAATAWALVIYVPLPYTTVTRGIVWLPDDAIVRAPEHCEIVRFVPAEAAVIEMGQELFVCEQPELRKEHLVARSLLKAKIAERQRLSPGQRAERRILDAEIRTARLASSRLEARLAQQSVRARTSGRLALKDSIEPEGRHFHRGEIIAFIVHPQQRKVRVAIDQQRIDRLNRQPQRVEVRFAEANALTYATSIERQTPKPSARMPTSSLTTAGGGSLVVDPRGDGQDLLEPAFEIELQWPAAAPPLRVGGHAEVKFVHTSEPLGQRLANRFREAFLGHISV